MAPLSAATCANASASALVPPPRSPDSTASKRSAGSTIGCDRARRADDRADRLLDAGHGFLMHAAAAVDHPVDGGGADARTRGDVGDFRSALEHGEHFPGSPGEGASLDRPSSDGKTSERRLGVMMSRHSDGVQHQKLQVYTQFFLTRLMGLQQAQSGRSSAHVRDAACQEGAMLRIDAAARAVRDRHNQNIAMTVSHVAPIPKVTSAIEDWHSGNDGQPNQSPKRPRTSPTSNWRAAPNKSATGRISDDNRHEDVSCAGAGRGARAFAGAARAGAGRRHPHRHHAAHGRGERPQIRPDGEGRARSHQRRRRHQRQEDRGHPARRRVQARQGHRQRQPLHPPEQGASGDGLDLQLGFAADGRHHREGRSAADRAALDQLQHHQEGQRLGVPHLGVGALLCLGAREISRRERRQEGRVSLHQ